MQILVEKIWDTLFPPTEGMLLVRNVDEEHIHTFLSPTYIGDATALTDFKDPHVRALIHETKFHANMHATRLLGTLLAEYLSTQNYSINTVLLPMPLSRKRKESRGYNQVEEVVRVAQKRLDKISIDTKMLKRIRDTKPQTELSREDRKENVEGAFRVTQKDRVFQKNIILIDDVLTTGATMDAAASELKKYHPSNITKVVLSH